MGDRLPDNCQSSAKPRLIYNLHPLLAGPITRWPDHFDRIVAMGFDTVYVNAFFAPGDSKSLYAISDPFELHPWVRGESKADAADLVIAFVQAARQAGLAVMTDLVIPHAARDGILVQNHPDWFRRDSDGALRTAEVPSLDPSVPPRILGDLVEVDLRNDAIRDALLDHYEEVAAHFLELGLIGFRCSAAYKVPPPFWRELFDRLRSRHPQAVFLAAALGCPFEQVKALDVSGFDMVFDSSAWWNFHESWYLEQHEALRRVGRTIAFPEDHNSGRLRNRFDLDDAASIERHYRGRYLAGLGLANGLMMPMGFEYGCGIPLNHVKTTPEDWRKETEDPIVDLTGFIGDANAAVSESDLLASGKELRRVTAPNARIVGLSRFDRAVPALAKEVVTLLANPDPTQSDGIATSSLITSAGGAFARFEDITPGVEPIHLEHAETLTLEPMAVRLFRAKRARPSVLPAPDDATSVRALRDLATNRVAIEKVSPELDGGRFPAKRMVGERLTVEADIFSDGHDKIAAALKYRTIDQTEWRETPMRFVDNDRWAGSFMLSRNTRYLFTIEAWWDTFASWCHEVAKKHDAGLDLSLEMIEGRDLVARTAAGAEDPDKKALELLLDDLTSRKDDQGYHLSVLLGEETKSLMVRADLREYRSQLGRELEVIVDRTAAAFAAWYELFPRSQSDDPDRHGTFDDVIAKLPYVRAMGFDVLYFPPIHPIGKTNRKGRNNSLKAAAGDPGSPYAIGSESGGHTDLHPELGSLDDFARMVAAAADHGLEIAIDFAIQCSPDHPWIKDHPEWFDWRPDGTLKFAETPPKKYEDISNVSIYREGPIPSLWQELRDVVLFWIQRGVKIFRVDNPHTKPFPFWEWLIREVQDQHPEAVFLAEAFSRPMVMSRLAKIGFTQSYSYFTWRNEKQELIEYLTQLTRQEARQHMRPNFFVNTPDINPVYLQTGGRAAFQVRAVLASTLSTLWGVYSGFELCEGTPVPGKEEYLNSEKYEIKAWDWDRAGNIRQDITLLNHIRKDNPALWQFANLTFQEAWDDHVLVYSKATDSLDNLVLVAVNLDPHHAHGCAFEVPLWTFGLADDGTIEVEDLVTGHRFTWTGKVQQIWLDPENRPYAIWRLVPPGMPR
ncbi:MAG: maltotransferase domain-containing protein [Geminicoccaceae bacterium]